jgi:hypothetical protein
MSSEPKFRMYFGQRPATADELGRVEEITVEQEIDVAWQATIKLFLCLDEKGNWKHEQDDFLKSFERVRVELQLDGRKWVPLIDGPIVEHHSEMDSQPGRSNIVLTVNDDTALLNREAEVTPNTGRSDSDIARLLFGTAPGATIIPERIESAQATDPGRIQRNTAIAKLRDLARRHEFHAYVLPSPTVGTSLGFFASDATSGEGLPDLVLLGTDRNLSNLQVTEEAQEPTRFRARSLSISDKQIVSRTSRLRDLTLLGPQATQPANATGTQHLPPALNREDDPERAVQAAAQRTSYSLRASGRVIPGCYTGVLQPHQVVTIRVGTTGLSGDYLLTKATHRITPSLYTQEFSAKRNGVEKTGAQPDLLGAIL